MRAAEIIFELAFAGLALAGVGVTMSAAYGYEFWIARICFALSAASVLIAYGLWLFHARRRPNFNRGAYRIWGILAVCAAAGVIIGGSHWISLREATATRNDGLIYFRTADFNIADTSGAFPLWAVVENGNVTKLNYWISPAAANKDSNNPLYGSIDARKRLIEIVHKGGHLWDRALPIGDYNIEFDAENGHWDESLSIYLKEGRIRNRIKIERDGAIVKQVDLPVQ